MSQLNKLNASLTYYGKKGCTVSQIYLIFAVFFISFVYEFCVLVSLFYVS